ncbi:MULTISPECIES: hypothetical protein [unclassified Bradyrhizobium]|uniref:hypothetical protein n=1 Tax=Bradyrhizobium sp. USDA 4541 TaxID=2817704 RepID=UPI002811F22F|nr:hypothetical protein [Bradyrhizobium sp. USDA 4541]
MDGLLFAITPTLPNQGRRLAACQPTIARLTFCREGHANRAPVKALFCMMVDRSAESLEVTARAAPAAAMFDVTGTGLRVDCRQLLATPKIVEPVDPRFNLKLITGLADVGQIDRQHVGAIDVVDIPSTALRLVFSRDVLC